jgi:hypothetical protein
MTATQTTSRDDNGIYLNEKLFFYKHLTFWKYNLNTYLTHYIYR